MASARSKIGKYTVLKEIGVGGFGAVYRVEEGGQQFALKQLSRANMDPEITERFIREALRVEELRKKYHLDYLVRIFDVLFKEHAFVMEYIPLGSTEYFSQAKDERYLELLVQYIQQLHQIGVVHRDIKPENLRVKDGKPVLIDFGIASWWDSRSNIIPTGTRYYSPPEIVCIFDEFKRLKAARDANKKLIEIIPEDAKQRIKYIKKLHDVYSLGITIGELLTGTLPFNRTTYVEYLDRGTCEAFGRWAVRIPGRFQPFIEKATAFFPDVRSQLDDLASDLEIKTSVSQQHVSEQAADIYFQEGYYRCRQCGKETMPPANFCPYCGESLTQLAMAVEPAQSIRVGTLPEAVRLHGPEVEPGTTLEIIIDLNGPDFRVSLGRNPEQSFLAFPDDNWMSSEHGELIKEEGLVYYSEGIGSKIPTNPSSINNIPVGRARMELFSGGFLLIGSTVFHIKKYFGTIRAGSSRHETV